MCPYLVSFAHYHKENSFFGVLKVSAAREPLDVLHFEAKLGQREPRVALIRHSSHFTARNVYR